MESVKILHIADMHIGRKFRHLTPKKAMLRNTEVLLSFENVLERFDDAQIVLLSGDICENDVSNSVWEFVIKIFKRHPDKKFFISFGNHDCIEYNAIKTFVSMLPKNVHAFSDTMEMVEVEGVSSPNTPTFEPSESVNTAFPSAKDSPVASTVIFAASAGKSISDMRCSSKSEP